MKVILLEKTANLGDLGDQVNVKSGYGRNYLLPYGKAIPATPANVEVFETRRAELEKNAADKLTQAQGRQRELEAVERITIASNAGDEGKLFGSIGTRDVAEAITAQGMAVDKSEIRMPDGAIRQVGEYEVNVQLHSDITMTILIEVVAE
ncbi:MAG: 50S ribosomal protein L9 [Pseudomonadota bacterium]